MRLSMVDLLNKVRPHGKLYRGKNRKVRAIKLEELFNLRRDFEREERNMLYLRYPYLTVEQSHGSMKGKKTWTKSLMEKKTDEKILKFSKQYSFAEAFYHLRNKDVWD